MASQLRLRVVLPVAVLGLLGLGIGAFAFKPPASSGDSPGPPAPQAGTTTGSTKKRETDWARRANTWCARVNAKLEAEVVDGPLSREELERALARLVQVQDSAAATFPKLGWPRGKKRAVLALRTTLTKITRASHDMVAALEAQDAAALRNAFERAQRLADTWNRGMTRLGAPVCAEDPLGALSDRAIRKYGSARAALNHELVKHRVVVVLFYAPGDDYDTIQTRETRAGALAVNAGFLAIDVTKNRTVSGLAAEYDVRDAPATLVFRRGPRVVYRVAGYMDRQAIAQAAATS